MPNAQHQIPDYTTDDAATYKAKIDGNAAVVARIGAAYQAYANSTPNMTVKVAAGALLVAGAVVENAIQTTGTITAPVSNSRIDRVVIDSTTGVVSVITGTSGVSPSAPALTAGKLPVAQVLLTSASTAITNSMITDERAMSAVIAGPATGSGLTMATARLLGRTTASSGAIEEISVSGGTFTGGTLTIPGITIATPVTWSSGTTSDITGIPSTAKRVVVAYDRISTNGTSYVILQPRASGAAETTNYFGSTSADSPGSTSIVELWTTGIRLDYSAAPGAATTRSGSVQFDLIGSNTWAVSGSGGYTNTAYVQTFGGSKVMGAALEGMRLTTNGGADTGDGGTWTVTWE